MHVKYTHCWKNKFIRGNRYSLMQETMCHLSRHLRDNFLFVWNTQNLNLLLPTLIPLSGVGTICFYHVLIKIRHLLLRPAACLTSTLLETAVDANDCKCSRDQQLNVPSEARRTMIGLPYNKFFIMKKRFDNYFFTHQSALGPRGGLWPVRLILCIRKVYAPAVGILIGWCWSILFNARNNV
jgi:hypothetical protein